MALLSFSAWLNANFSRSRFSRGASRRVRRPPGPRFLRLEALESRTVLSASPFMVSNLQDAGYGSLRQAILDANATPGADVIYFANNLHGTIKLTSGDLAVSAKNLMINGPGENQLTVSGNNLSRVFDIGGSASASIAGLTITEGRANSGGGILVEDSAALSISNCSLTDNEALGISVAPGSTAGGGFGGAIEDNSAGALTVTNSAFGGNTAVGIGANNPVTPGYILVLGGAIDVSFNSTGPATIRNSTFTGNQALGGSPGASAGGGALSNSSNVGATMTVTGCTLSGNAAIGAAGGDGITNFGSGQGGGINNFANLIVRNSTLTNNLALGTPLAPGAVPSQTVSSGSATAGGGIFCLPGTPGVTHATAIVTDSTLVGNQAVGGAGAAGSAEAAASAGSIGEGGGISLVFVDSALVVGCTLADNVARGGAGGRGWAGGQGGLGAPGVSGGIDLAFGSPVTVSNTTLTNNQAIGGAGGAGSKGGDGVGGGVNVGTGVIYGASDNCSLTLTDSTIIGNVAHGGAGGAGASGGDGLGGGISVLAGNSASIDTTQIVANAALGGSSGWGGVSGQGVGGGLYIEADADVTLTPLVEVTWNFASTSADNIFGSYTVS
ncbi:MAG: right-handed parallel beta-helix repeat-containing protein [Thermoguttaceae bacterium]